MAEKSITLKESELQALVMQMVEAKLAESGTAAVKAPLPKDVAEAEAKARELVKLKIPKTKDKRDDVFVGLNGKGYIIKRGVEVEVPRAIVEILNNSEEQDMLAADLVDEGERKLEELQQR